MRGQARLWLTSLFAAGLLPALALAQSGNIEGRVVEQTSNNPVPSAQIQVVGTTRGAVTNETGGYRIANIAPGTYTLRALRIGFQSLTQTITVGASGTVTANFALPAVAIKLDEVVTTATGATERKRETGNAIGTLQPSIAENANTQNVAQQLTGKIPGVDVASPGGTLGSSSRIRIRGASSVSLSNDPLVIIDGVRINSAVGSSTIGVGGQTPSRLNDINPEDIDTYTVLKGPAAAALYGTAAAPGVIVITTKHGRTGSARWSVFGEGGHITDVTNYPANYAQIGVTPAGARTTGCTLDAQTRGACTPKPDSLVSFNPLVQSSPFIQGHRGSYGASVQGGTEQTTYYVAGDYDREQGVVFSSQDQRTNMRANLNAQLRNNWNLQIGTGYLADHLRLPQNDNDVLGIVSGGILGSALCTRDGSGGIICPGSPPDTTSHGYIAGQPPQALYAIDTKQDVQRFTNSVSSTYQPLSWLTALGNAGLDFIMRHDNEVVPPNKVFFGSLPQGQRTSNPYQIYNYTANGGLAAVWNATANLRATTGAGAQFNKEMFRGTRAFGAVLLPGTFSLSGTSARFAVSEENTDNKTLGGYVTEQLAYADRLFLNAALRTDNNSAFGQNFGFIKYPSVSGSWVVNEQGFFPKQNIVPSLRLRAAYGQSGQRPNFRDAITYFNEQTVSVGGADVPGIIVGGTGNIGLRPEKSKEFELGFDAGILGNRANLEVTHYRKHTDDLLVAVPLPGSLGLTTTQFKNLGSSQNQGWEEQLTAGILDSDPLKFDLTLTATTNDNKLLSLGLLPSGAPVPPIVVNSIQQHRAGYPLGGYWARPFTFTDVNNDGIIARSEITLGDTAVYLGNPLPKREWAINPHFTIMRFVEISALFDHKGGYKLFNNTRRFQCNFRNCREAYDKTSPFAAQAAAIEAITGASDAGYVENADFTKFRELSFTFGLPQRFAGALGGRTANLVIAGRNLHTWTKYTGFDPEVNSTPNGNFGTSDFLTLPPDRIWNVRINLSF
jgi:TonB-dependent starch-binding outer membrane protein SusC